MKKMNIILMTVGLLFAAPTVHAQDEVETTVSADVVNRYIWRGIDCGNISVQPTLGVAYKGLSLSAWGNVGLDKQDAQELDLTLSYNKEKFTVGVTDLWFNNTADPRYFYYNAHGTSHVFEGFLGYDFGVFSATWYTVFAGNDGVNKDGKRAYSSYFELNAPFKLGGVDWTATAAAVPHSTTTYGTSGFAVTNLSLKASKDIQVTDRFKLPVFGQVIANPCSQKAYFVFGFTLQP